MSREWTEDDEVISDFAVAFKLTDQDGIQWINHVLGLSLPVPGNDDDSVDDWCETLTRDQIKMLADDARKAMAKNTVQADCDDLADLSTVIQQAMERGGRPVPWVEAVDLASSVIKQYSNNRRLRRNCGRTKEEGQ